MLENKDVYVKIVFTFETFSLVLAPGDTVWKTKPLVELGVFLATVIDESFES